MRREKRLADPCWSGSTYMSSIWSKVLRMRQRASNSSASTHKCISLSGHYHLQLKKKTFTYVIMSGGICTNTPFHYSLLCVCVCVRMQQRTYLVTGSSAPHNHPTSQSQLPPNAVILWVLPPLLGPLLADWRKQWNATGIQLLQWTLTGLNSLGLELIQVNESFRLVNECIFGNGI